MHGKTLCFFIFRSNHYQPFFKKASIFYWRDTDTNRLKLPNSCGIIIHQSNSNSCVISLIIFRPYLRAIFLVLDVWNLLVRYRKKNYLLKKSCWIVIYQRNMSPSKSIRDENKILIHKFFLLLHISLSSNVVRNWRKWMVVFKIYVFEQYHVFINEMNQFGTTVHSCTKNKDNKWPKLRQQQDIDADVTEQLKFGHVLEDY